MRKQCLNAASIYTAPLTFCLENESRVGLLCTPTRACTSLSIFLSLSFSLLLFYLLLSLSLCPYSLSLSQVTPANQCFPRYFLFPSMQNACNRMRLSLLLPSSKPKTIKKKGNFRFENRNGIGSGRILAPRLRQRRTG